MLPRSYPLALVTFALAGVALGQGPVVKTGEAAADATTVAIVPPAAGPAELDVLKEQVATLQTDT